MQSDKLERNNKLSFIKTIFVLGNSSDILVIILFLNSYKLLFGFLFHKIIVSSSEQVNKFPSSNSIALSTTFLWPVKI